MEPLRGSMIELNAVSIIDEIPPGFTLNPDHSIIDEILVRFTIYFRFFPG
jgi:hypothetical protein